MKKYFPTNYREGEEAMKYYIVFDDGNLRIIVAVNLTYQAATEFIEQQSCLHFYKIRKMEELMIRLPWR